MPKNAVAIQVAKEVIKYARDITYPNIEILLCPDCRLFPVLPVTGQCGHTRCTKCVERNRSCFCGCILSKPIHINILVQQLLEKMLPPELRQFVEPDQSSMPSTSSICARQARLLPKSPGPLRHYKRGREDLYSAVPYSNTRHPYLADPEIRFNYAQDLVGAGQYRIAAPHLAHVAASEVPFARRAFDLLVQIIGELVKSTDRYRLTRELYRAVRGNVAAAWLAPADLECVICYQVLNRPVTTPCGHTFCRECILRTIDESKRCAFCRRPLDHLSIILTSDTSFVSAAKVAVIPKPLSPIASGGNLVPIFKCTVAYPTVPCPFLIIDPCHWVTIRRILDSGYRRVGMVTSFGDGSLAAIGTIVEVRDCFQLEDGQTILSTVGITRFHIIKAYFDNCNIARVVELIDIIPTVQEVTNLKLERLAEEITDKAMLWLSRLTKRVMSDIEEAFGPMPQCCDEAQWWANPQCPKWLWWIIAILPLKPEIQVLMLSTRCLFKRMMAVSRTLDVIMRLKMHMSVRFSLERIAEISMSIV